MSSSNWNGQIFSKCAISWAFELQGCWAWLTSSDLCGDCVALDHGSEYLIVRHTTKLKLIDLKSTHRLCKLGHSTQIFTLGDTSGFDGFFARLSYIFILPKFVFIFNGSREWNFSGLLLYIYFCLLLYILKYMIQPFLPGLSILLLRTDTAKSEPLMCFKLRKGGHFYLNRNTEVYLFLLAAELCWVRHKDRY